MLLGPDRVKLDQFITGVDSLTPNDAMLLAVAAIDGGTFSRRSAERGTATDMPPRRGRQLASLGSQRKKPRNDTCRR